MISVVVPVFNEAANVQSLLLRLQQLKQQGAQVLLVDGGSSDGTPDLLTHGGFAVHLAKRGRALQMNAGAELALHSMLLFLHADTVLPEHAMQLIVQRLGNGDSTGASNGASAEVLQRPCWGRFDVQIDGKSPWLGCVAGLMNVRSRLTGIATGDQAMFMTRSAFAAVHGFPPQPLMEDIAMSVRLKRLGPPLCLRDKVVTSGRRWDANGVWRTIALMWRLRWAYWRGVDPAILAKAYQ